MYGLGLSIHRFEGIELTSFAAGPMAKNCSVRTGIAGAAALVVGKVNKKAAREITVNVVTAVPMAWALDRVGGRRR
ncbi:hypothetical protein KPATCC21470_1347 [Kitasatospora purpeofusca]